MKLKKKNDPSKSASHDHAMFRQMIASLVTNIFLLSGLAFLIVFHSMVSFNYQSSPITSCLHVYDESELVNRYSLKYSRNKSLFSFLEHCQSDYCKKVVRVCSEDETPGLELCESFHLILFFFVITNLIAPIILNYLADCEVIYEMTKKLKCFKPLIHFTFLQDSLKDNRAGCWKIRRLKLIVEAYSIDPEILNKKGIIK